MGKEQLPDEVRGTNSQYPQRISSMARSLRRTLSAGIHTSRSSDSLVLPVTPVTPSPLSSTITQASSPDSQTSTHSESKTPVQSLLNVLGQAGKRMTPSFRSQTSLSSHILSPALSPNDQIEQQRVNKVVDGYMEMSDRRECGYVDVSRMRRRLGMGPKKKEERLVYYEVFGSGPRKLFLIMGMMGCTMYWRLQTRYFASLGDYTICVFDNCGSGQSTVAPGPYRISQLARDARMVLDRINWHDDIHMVGISLGGMIAQELCVLDTPDRPRFASVIFVDTWHSASLAMPTVKEVRFAFSGMAALGNDPRHLIDLVFSREWSDAEFHDSVQKDKVSRGVTNRKVMTCLFREIQRQLSQKQKDGEGGLSCESSPVDVDDTDLGLIDEKKNWLNRRTQTLDVHITSQRSSPGPAQPRPVEYSRTEPVRRAQFPTPISNMPAEDPVKRKVSGDIHQFMACLGHRFTSQRVRQIRLLNPSTRFLVIHGEKDRVIRPFCGRTLAKLLQCPIAWIQRAGHMPPIDSHCTFNLVVRAFTRDEMWLRDVEDRTCLVPAGWEEQVKVKEWIGGGMGEMVVGEDRLACEDELESSELSTKLESKAERRDSRIDHIWPIGPIHRDLFIVDESDPSLPPRIIPASHVSTQSQPTPNRELAMYGALLDAPLRIRRYS
ncbi:hypothetical protein GGF45_001445 [Coemansia sp. RSA 551]|nr:hypothetical protein GGF45_001445 [Coemansia sp. RSA 551]